MKKLVLTAIAAVMLAPMLPAVAQADPPGYAGSDNNNRQGDRDNRGDAGNARNGNYVVYGRSYERVRGPAWNAPRNYSHRDWRRGQRLPSSYRTVVINDYRAYHLRAPPRGYRYVRVDDDIVLAAIASGLISSVIANAFLNN